MQIWELLETESDKVTNEKGIFFNHSSWEMQMLLWLCDSLQKALLLWADFFFFNNEEKKAVDGEPKPLAIT